MHSITIREISKEGELRWVIRLTDEENRPVLESTVPLSKGDSLSTAKALKHRGSDGALKFALAAPDAVKDLLAKAEIRWDPPDADPACKEKQADRTPTKGIPGS